MSYSIMDQIDNIFSEFVENLIELEEFVDVTAKEIGLDERSAYSGLKISMSGILVPTKYVGKMEYYGGFEYIDKEYVRELGEYRFYSSKASRVKDCINQYFKIEETEDNEDEE